MASAAGRARCCSSIAARLLPTRNSTQRYCQLWKPLLSPSVGRIAEYSVGVIVDNTSHAWTSCSMIRLTRDSILNVRSS